MQKSQGPETPPRVSAPGLSMRDRFRAEQLNTAASAYVPRPCLVLTKTAEGHYRLSYTFAMGTTGMADKSLEHPPLARVFINDLGTGMPRCLARAFKKAGLLALRGNTILSLKDPKVKPLLNTMTDFGSMIGYGPSMWSAIMASGFMPNINVWINKSQNPDGSETGADGSGFYILDKDTNHRLSMVAFNGKDPQWDSQPMQIRGLTMVPGANGEQVGLFAKGLLVAVKPEHLPKHLRDAYFATHKDDRPRAILCTEQFKGGGNVLYEGKVMSSSKWIKEASKKATAEGVPFHIRMDVGVMQRMGPSKKEDGMQVSPQVTVRCKAGAARLYWEIFQDNWGRWVKKGGVTNTVNKVLSDDDDDFVEMANFKALAEKLKVNPMVFPPVYNRVKQVLGKKLYRLATGFGLNGDGAALVINNGVPVDHIVIPRSWDHIKHGQRVVFGRYPIVGLRGARTIEVIQLGDPNCPEELRKKFDHLSYQNTITASSAQIVIDVTGDDDGDRGFVITDPRLVKAFDEFSYYTQEPTEAVFIEGYPKDSATKSRPVLDAIEDCSQDMTGAVGVFTNLQDYFLALGMVNHANACSALIQVCVDRKKNIVPAIDIRKFVDPDNWAWEERHGKRVLVPKSWPLLEKRFQDPKNGYEDVSVMFAWAKEVGGIGLKRVCAWEWVAKGEPKLKKSINWAIVDGLQDGPWDPEEDSPDCMKIPYTPVESYEHIECLEPIRNDPSALPIVYREAMYTFREYFTKNTLAQDNCVTPDHLWKMAQELDPSLDIRKRQRRSNYETAASFPKWAQDASKMLSQLGITKIGEEVAKEPPDTKDGEKLRMDKINAAKALAVGAVEKLDVYQLLQLFEDATVMHEGVSLAAWQLISLGNNALSKLIGTKIENGCPFIKEHKEEFLAKVKEMTENPHPAYRSSGWGGAAIALINGAEWKPDPASTADKPLPAVMLEKGESRFAALHLEKHGTMLKNCEHCAKELRYIMMSAFRKGVPENLKTLMVDTIRVLNWRIGYPIKEVNGQKSMPPQGAEEFRVQRELEAWWQSTQPKKRSREEWEEINAKNAAFAAGSPRTDDITSVRFPDESQKNALTWNQIFNSDI